MYLQKLEIQGFKSFANKTVLEFPHLKTTRGITAVVGPNGSGKSNVADSVRWALGEQSLKLLRGKKSEDVIFSGSQTKGRLGFAEVSLFLNNEDKKMPIDYSEVIITRRIYRNGEGEYYINKNKVRLQDILILLAKSSFGQKTYSVIGQGMIDSFLMAPPQEKKEFIDEAVGIREFQLKREQALNKLIATKENLEQTLTVINELTPQIRSLTRQVNRLEKREKIEQELKGLQQNYYGSLLQTMNGELKKISHDYKNQEKLQQDKQRIIEQIQKKINAFEEEKSRSQIFGELQNKHNTLNHKKGILLRELATLNGKLDLEFEKIGKVDIVWINRKIEEMTLDSKKANEDIKSNEHLIKKLNESILEKENSLENLKNELALMEEKISTYKKETSKKSEISMPEIQAEIEKIYYLQEVLLSDIERVSSIDQLTEIKAKLKELKDFLYSLNNKIKGTDQEDYSQKIIELQEELSGLVHKKSELLSEVNSLKMELRFSQEKNNALSLNLEKIERETGKLQSQKEASVEKDKDKIIKDITAQKHLSENELGKIDSDLKKIEMEINNFNQSEESKKKEIFEIQKEAQKEQFEQAQINQKLTNIRIELAKLETKKEDLEKEIINALGSLSEIDNEKHYEISDNQSEEQEKIHNLKHQLELIGAIEPETLEEYNKTKERYDFLESQSNDLRGSLKSLEELILDLDKNIIKQFDEGFDKINDEFQKYFKVLFNGGNAKLIKIKNVDEEEKAEEQENGASAETNGTNGEASSKKEEAENLIDLKRLKKSTVYSGIDIQATPPGKRLQNINMLSGGEKALTSIALICAIISNNPSPFVILDEVDAALDESNSIRFSQIVEDLSKKTQFIVITHNRASMEKANVLYGVTMGEDGVSKILSIKLEEGQRLVNR